MLEAFVHVLLFTSTQKLSKLCDRQKLKNIKTNLIKNSGHLSDHGEIMITAFSSCRQKERFNDACSPQGAPDSNSFWQQWVIKGFRFKNSTTSLEKKILSCQYSIKKTQHAYGLVSYFKFIECYTALGGDQMKNPA